MKRLTIISAFLALATSVASAQQASLLAEARRQLAAGRFADAASMYRQCLEQAPADTAVMSELATALDAAGRWPEALPYVERLVALAPPNVPRLTKLAQYLAWSGSSRRAATVFAEAWALDSANAGVLAAYGDFLSWHPHTRTRGIAMLRRALELEPHNPVTREQLANAELDHGRYSQAAKLVRALEPGAFVRRALADSLVRATRLGVDADGWSTERRALLSSEGVAVGLVAPRGYARAEVRGASAEFSDALGRVRGAHGEAGVRYDNASSLQLEAIAGNWFGGGLSRASWDGRFSVRTPVGWPVGVSGGWERGPVLETRRSFIGIPTVSMVRGAVSASTARAGIRLSLGPLEATADGASASYQGENIETNHRSAIAAQATYVVRRFAPWLRLGYEFRSQRFSYNAMDYAGTPLRFGGYFSPHRDVVNLGVLQASHRVVPALLLEVDARAGREAVRTSATGSQDTHDAAVIYGHAAWRLAHSADLDLTHLYVNVFAAFRMRETRLSLKRYF